jgi:hypothetical protein
MYRNDIISYTHPYINGSIDDYQFNIIIDSGAQVSMFSSNIVQVLGLEHLIDKSTRCVIKGVGQQNMVGSIQINLKVCSIFIPLTVTIIDTDDYLFLVGLDFLYSHNCQMDFKNRCIQILDNNIKFLNEIEIQNSKFPINITKEKLKKEYNIIKNTLQPDSIQLIKRIINNIIKNPTIEKYKQINKNSKIFTNINNNKCDIFLKSLGFIENNDKLRFCGELARLKYTKEIIG